MAHELEVIARECDGESSYPPLLFVHGSCHAAWCWDEHFLPYFAERGFDSYALSLRGHGESSGPGSLRWTSIAAYVADVEAVAADLRAEPVVVGHSLGGLVVQKYLERHDSPGAVLVAPAPRRGRGRGALRLLWRAPALSARLLLTMEPRTLFATPELCRRLLFSPATSDEVVDRCAERIGRESFRAWLEMLVLRLDARRIGSTPILILGAVGDRLISADALRTTAGDYGADLTMIPEMGHDMMLEGHWPKAAEAMHDWLLRTLTAA
ncbi:MAG: lysophospholipase [Dehalococcoidia bacterium]|nr:lysophospholipase [Dehalococcoidia bacterium]MYI85834.1 lysophospholipase [Dehalococcoidia bacterium]